MAKQVTCACGKSFHVSTGTTRCQCRRCGRTWQDVGFLGAIATVALGGEIARRQREKGDRERSRERPSYGKQTNRRPTHRSTIGSVLRFFFG